MIYDKIKYTKIDIKSSKLYLHQCQQADSTIGITQTCITQKGITLTHHAKRHLAERHEVEILTLPFVFLQAVCTRVKEKCICSSGIHVQEVLVLS